MSQPDTKVCEDCIGLVGGSRNAGPWVGKRCRNTLGRPFRCRPLSRRAGFTGLLAEVLPQRLLRLIGCRAGPVRIAAGGLCRIAGLLGVDAGLFSGAA